MHIIYIVIGSVLLLLINNVYVCRYIFKFGTDEGNYGNQFLSIVSITSSELYRYCFSPDITSVLVELHS